MSGVEFLLSQWGEDVLRLEISLVDASPDGLDENVFCAKVNDREIYFEAHSEADIPQILQAAIDAIKELTEYEPF